MISLAVFLLKPNFGSIALTKGFMILRQCSFEKEVTTRGYCMAGSQIFLYSQNALTDDMDDLVTLDMMFHQMSHQYILSCDNCPLDPSSRLSQ
eukprot:3367621-Ditylum_brightwellii.AAC.1